MSNYDTSELIANSLVNLENEPYRENHFGTAVDLPNGQRVEVYFTRPGRDLLGDSIEELPTLYEVCQTIGQLTQWIGGGEYES